MLFLGHKKTNTLNININQYVNNKNNWYVIYNRIISNLLNLEVNQDDHMELVVGN